jgi:hypothetical protein
MSPASLGVGYGQEDVMLAICRRGFCGCHLHNKDTNIHSQA